MARGASCPYGSRVRRFLPTTLSYGIHAVMWRPREASTTRRADEGALLTSNTARLRRRPGANVRAAAAARRARAVLAGAPSARRAKVQRCYGAWRLCANSSSPQPRTTGARRHGATSAPRAALGIDLVKARVQGEFVEGGERAEHDAGAAASRAWRHDHGQSRRTGAGTPALPRTPTDVRLRRRVSRE